MVIVADAHKADPNWYAKLLKYWDQERKKKNGSKNN